MNKLQRIGYNILVSPALGLFLLGMGLIYLPLALQEQIEKRTNRKVQHGVSR